MKIRPKKSGIHHIAVRSTDMARSRTFYNTTLGFSRWPLGPVKGGGSPHAFSSNGLQEGCP